MKKHFLVIILFAGFLFSCQHNDEPENPIPIIQPDTIPQTTIDTISTKDTLPLQDTSIQKDTILSPDTSIQKDTIIKPTISRISVLTYHKVVAEDSLAIYSTQVSVRKLEDDFRWLASNGYTAILPRDLLSLDSFPQKTVIITFDDGYYNNYLYMYPLLKKYGLKAEISLIVSWITEERSNGWLTWGECREMSESGLVEIGSHTYSLHNPSNGGSYIRGSVNGVGREVDESDDDYRARITTDLQKSKDIITERIGMEPVSFAYPYGEGNYFINKYISELFEVTFLTNNGSFNPKSDLHLLPRNTITMDTQLQNILK